MVSKQVADAAALLFNVSSSVSGLEENILPSFFTGHQNIVRLRTACSSKTRSACFPGCMAPSIPKHHFHACLRPCRQVLIVFVNKLLMDPRSGHGFVFGEQCSSNRWQMAVWLRATTAHLPEFLLSASKMT
eukprot:190732-Chlamydomonas_euryale.AAC.6